MYTKSLHTVFIAESHLDAESTVIQAGQPTATQADTDSSMIAEGCLNCQISAVTARQTTVKKCDTSLLWIYKRLD